MAESLVSLRTALEERDRLLGFASRLEDLKAEGTLSAADYSAGRSDYDGRIAAVTARIQALKSAIRKELEASEREGDLCRLKLEGAEANHLAGELTDTEFRAEERRWNAHQRRVEERCSELEIALTAESAEDLGDMGVAIAPEQPTTPAAPEKKAKPAKLHAAAAATSTAVARGWTRLRIAALVAAVLLLVSVRLTWIAPTDLLGKDLGGESGASVSFLAAVGGLLCGLAGIGVSFVRTPHTRGLLQIAAGIIAICALVAAVFLGELPLHDSYFRELVILREGFFAYVVAALGLTVLGFLQWRRYP
jgi:hypothetical protein